MKHYYYSNTIQNFLLEANHDIYNTLVAEHSNRTLEGQQKNAWKRQIEILKDQLKGFEGQIYFEFSIPRMGKKVDNIVIINDKIFVIEFKVGSLKYEKSAIEQVIDYTLDLKNFHEGSHNLCLIPILVATKAESSSSIKYSSKVVNHESAALSNENNLQNVFKVYIDYAKNKIDINPWENSIYKPTPTIIEAAQALYEGHNVQEISRSDSGAINLSKTTDCINKIIEDSKSKNKKSICFVTGVPGAGKTLAGLNIAAKRTKADEGEHAVFLSGNGPLVEVLREALTRDEVLRAKLNGQKLNKKEATRKTNAFIQNIHHFRDSSLLSKVAPSEKIVIFDESQRAWNKEQLNSFMKRKKGIEDFDMSEPKFLINIMNRCQDWCIIVCLVGGGQEINTGEAGLEEWINSLKIYCGEWNIYYSNLISENNNYIKSTALKSWLKNNGKAENELHLSVSVRSFRAEKLSEFIHNLLEINRDTAKELLLSIKNKYPIVLTRDLTTAKTWLRQKAKGSERIGIISSSGARRLRVFGIDVKNEISASNWFLNDKDDIRSSYFLEEVATEFDIQGLEIDWACVAWGANFYINNRDWKYQNFKGTKWQNINKAEDREYLKNAYRVLLTRARQGLVIFVPNGSCEDITRDIKFYDETYEYLSSLGLETI